MLKKVLIIIGLSLTLIAAIFLYSGSKSVAWEIQTWDGQSQKEVEFKKDRERYTKAGFGFLAIGFFLQLIGEVIRKRKEMNDD